MINGEVLENALRSGVLALRYQRGRFYPDKDFGSLLYTVQSADSTALLLAYARQAVKELDGVFVKSVHTADGAAVFDITINNENRQVSIELE